MCLTLNNTHQLWKLILTLVTVVYSGYWLLEYSANKWTYILENLFVSTLACKSRASMWTFYTYYISLRWDKVSTLVYNTTFQLDCTSANNTRGRCTVFACDCSLASLSLGMWLIVLYSGLLQRRGSASGHRGHDDSARTVQHWWGPSSWAPVHVDITYSVAWRLHHLSVQCGSLIWGRNIGFIIWACKVVCLCGAQM